MDLQITSWFGKPSIEAFKEGNFSEYVEISEFENRRNSLNKDCLDFSYHLDSVK